MSKEAHRFHTRILEAADVIAGAHKIRRFPLLNQVLVTSVTHIKEILDSDGVLVGKATRLNSAISSTTGQHSLIASPETLGGQHALEIRQAIGEFIHLKSKQYLENLGNIATDLTQSAKKAGGLRNVYSAIHSTHIEALLSVFGPVSQARMPRLQKEIIGLSAELGTKTLLGSVGGEWIITATRGSRHRRRAELDVWVDDVVARNTGLWDVGREGALSKAFLRDNLLLMTGAGTTSPAATATWTIYDAGTNDRFMNSLRSANGKREMTQVMAHTLRRHPFSFVLNRKALQDFSIGGQAIRKGDEIWMLTVPHSNRNSGLQKEEADMFGAQFGHGPRSCVGQSLGIAAFGRFMSVWNEQINDWVVTKRPRSPIYYPTLKPDKMDVEID